jgi:DNA processing protein
MIRVADDVYPTQLKTIDDPPIFLYYKGSLEITKQPCIAAIGTRTMSAYGDRVTEAFVPPLVRAGMVTVSGLAYGIDAAVAKETLLAGGNTIAVLGHGLGMISPKAHRMLADDIVTHGGLLLSEFPLDVRPDKYTFPARNRIIAGLSLGALILEATEDSGSLITADLALDYNRDVFAVPGNVFDPNYAGCHALIRKGSAQLVTTRKQSVLRCCMLLLLLATE